MKKDALKRILALVLVAALIVTMIISILVSYIDPHAGHAHAEEAPRNQYVMDIELIEDQQALRVSQRLDFYNDTGDALDRVMFAVYGNMFRRQLTVMYEDEAAMPWGYAPGGVEFRAVRVNGESADWGLSGDGEYFMRVACALAPGEACVFEFEFDVLLSANGAFLGTGGADWRLSGFYPILCVYTDGIWEANTPVQHSRYTYTTAADYEVKLTLPENYCVAATGEEELLHAENGVATWRISARNIREFAVSCGRAWRKYSAATDSGVAVNVYSANRLGGPKALELAVEAVELYEEWFGDFPVTQVDIAGSGYGLSELTFSGCIWIEDALFKTGGRDELKYAIRLGLAEQYFGLAVYADPLADAWLCAGVCEYITYLAWEEIEGESAFLKRLNERITPSLQITVPGDLFVVTDGSLFTQAQFDVVVRDRGAAVMHELRSMAGRESLIKALAGYYSQCRDIPIVTEMDFLKAINDATGKDWEDFLTELVFNIDEYSRQNIEWLE